MKLVLVHSFKNTSLIYNNDHFNLSLVDAMRERNV